MANQEFITNTILSGSNQDIPFWKKYPTPIYSKEELHKSDSGLLVPYDFSMEYMSVYIMAEKINNSFEYDKKLKKMNEENLHKENIRNHTI